MRLVDVLDTWTVKTVTVNPQASLAEAAQAMQRTGVTAALIVEDNRLHGLVTAADILRVLATATSPVLAWNGPITAVLSGEPQVVTPEEPVSQAIAKMTTAGIDHLPVVDAQGFVVVTLSRLLLVENAFLNGEVHYLQTYIDALHDAPND